MNAIGRHPTISVSSATDRPELYLKRVVWEEKFRQIGLWPELLMHDQVAQSYASYFDKSFFDYQLLALDEVENKVAGVAHSAPLYCPFANEELPDAGWDWALKEAVGTLDANQQPNTVCGFSITVLPEYQRRGVGRALINAVLRHAWACGYARVIMPVRPLLKEHHPTISMEEFLKWRRPDGLHHDPWIRAHQRAGATTHRPCPRSMTVVATLAEWQNWSGHSFKTSGDYVVTGCLAPVEINLETGLGTYNEPNLWMAYSSKSTHL